MSLEPFLTVHVAGPRDGVSPPALPPGLDAAIRELDRACQMQGGAIELEFRTEPSFAAAMPSWGNRHQIVFLPELVGPPGDLLSQGPAASALLGVSPPGIPMPLATEGPSVPGLEGNVLRIGALGIRSVRDVWLGGRRRPVAYFHHLRIHPTWRGGTTLARGFRAIRAAGGREPAVVTFTSILAANRQARSVLENKDGRGPLPRYLPICRYQTVLFPLVGFGSRWPRRARTLPGEAGLEVRPLTDADLPDLRDLYDDFTDWHDCVPVLGEGPDLLPGLRAGDFLGAWRQGTLVAAVARWDQSGVKQFRLTGGEGWWGPVWKLARQALGLPDGHGDIPYALFDPWVVRRGEARCLAILLDAVLERARAAGSRFAAWGVPVGHPMEAVRQRFFHLPYESIIYQVTWHTDTRYKVTPGHQPWFNLGML